ncbi:MAG: DUF4258 domain-containing protein [Dehalococcoidia bacterium]|nr:DUF4258 domain-containing protein [Dehalococcoidia bacterium]
MGGLWPPILFYNDRKVAVTPSRTHNPRYRSDALTPGGEIDGVPMPEDESASLILTSHLRQRMRERGILKEAVRRALMNYHTQRPAGLRRGARAAVILVGVWDGRALRVYVERGSDPPRIVAAARGD